MRNTTTLGELIEQLHEANQKLAEVAAPLDSLSELNFGQREQLSAQIRAALERWESVTHQIKLALAQE